MRFLYLLMFFCGCSLVQAQKIGTVTKNLLDKVDKLQNRKAEAIKTLEGGLQIVKLPIDLAYLYARMSIIYTSTDSLAQAKKMADESMESAILAKSDNALAIAYRSIAYLNNKMNLPDLVVKDALLGLKEIEKSNDADFATAYHLYYLLYGAHSKWDDGEKMEKYIRKARQYAIKARNIDLQANANNGISSMYQARYKKIKNKNWLDSSLHYLNQSYALNNQYPHKIRNSTLVITCVNLANYYLEYATDTLPVREKKAFTYLNIAEAQLNKKDLNSENWMNIYGIKSGFAKQKGDRGLAEQYLLKGLSQLMMGDGKNYKLEYLANKELADMALHRNDLKSVLIYHQKAESLLKKSFNEQQLLNTQKLEVQYETQKKEKELQLLKERAGFRKTQNYLYGGIVLTLLFALIFMFSSYHFKLKYAIAREKKLGQEKQDAEQQAQLQLKLQMEEQARLKAEQELLDLRKQQLEKEALANSLIIDRKNDTLKKIQQKIQSGEASDIKTLLKEEMLVQADFEHLKTQVQELHPDFFNRLSEKAIQKLTPLDLKYCTFLYLKMDTKQIAQALHVEPQSVRMFKYRLKQKFALGKEDDLEGLLFSY